MRSLLRFLLPLAVLLVSACGTGYDFKPNMAMCSEPAFYSSCHPGP